MREGRWQMCSICRPWATPAASSRECCRSLTPALLKAQWAVSHVITTASSRSQTGRCWRSCGRKFSALPDEDGGPTETGQEHIAVLTAFKLKHFHPRRAFSPLLRADRPNRNQLCLHENTHSFLCCITTGAHGSRSWRQSTAFTLWVSLH